MTDNAAAIQLLEQAYSDMHDNIARYWWYNERNEGLGYNALVISGDLEEGNPHIGVECLKSNGTKVTRPNTGLGTRALKCQ